MYKIRKHQTYTVKSHTEVATLDPEKFRNLSIPFNGTTEEEFLYYISSLDYYDIYEELDEETNKEINKFFDNQEWTDYYNSALNGEETWFVSEE